MGPDSGHPFCAFSVHFLDPFSEHFFVHFGVQNRLRNSPKNELKKRPILDPFLSQIWELQNARKSAPKMGPENDAKKSKNPELNRGPVLLPSVAAQRQHLKPQLKLSFGTSQA